MKKSELQFLEQLESTINARRSSSPESSYTASLFAAGSQRIAQKLGEEAIEVALAASAADRKAIIEESADLVYHLLVLLANAEIGLADVVSTLQARHKS